MKPARLVVAILSVALWATVAAGAATAAPSCTGQFVSVAARIAQPLGQTVVVPEVRNLTFGGPNLGQEVKLLFATADREACPVTP